MTERFLNFMPFIFEWEGEAYENDPDDPGGETKFGIDKRSHPEVDIKHLTREHALEIYWKEWLQDGCDPMPSPYAEVFFNCAVNMGLGRAQEFDRKIPGASAHDFLALQDQKYEDIASAHPKLRKYLRGWHNRTSALRKHFSL